MNNLIMMTFSSKFGFNTVSARELHEKLGVKTRYREWLPRMCEYGFEQEIDYFTPLKNVRRADGTSMPHALREDFLTIEMAKEICMIQRTPIGREFRQYFIECEKQLRGIYQLTLPFENSSRVLVYLIKILSQIYQNYDATLSQNQKTPPFVAKLLTTY